MNDLKDLKSKAYDLLATIQALQNQLGQVNQAISQKIKEEELKKKEEKEEVKSV